jgi:hypothetical protein
VLVAVFEAGRARRAAERLAADAAEAKWAAYRAAVKARAAPRPTDTGNIQSNAP